MKETGFVPQFEPIFGISISFSDGSKPINYYNLNLKQTAVVLQEWGEDWILVPDPECKLDATVWKWFARERRKKTTPDPVIEEIEEQEQEESEELEEEED